MGGYIQHALYYRSQLPYVYVYVCDAPIFTYSCAANPPGAVCVSSVMESNFSIRIRENVRVACMRRGREIAKWEKKSFFFLCI